MRRGEVWWALPRLGGAPPKRRPFLVVSDDAFNANLRYPKVLVVHLTSVRRLGGAYAWEVELRRGAAGLPHASVAKCAEVYTLFKDDLAERSGTLPADAMDRVDRALSVALGLGAARQDAD